MYDSDGNRRQRLVIECKNVPAFSSEQLHRAIDQLKRYADAAGPSNLVLAFPGRVHATDKESLTAANIEVWDLDYIATTFSNAIQATAHPYFQSLFQAVIRKPSPRKEDVLIGNLKSCSRGTSQWSVYQKLVGDILEHLFCPPLETPISQSADAADVNRRDYILPNYAESGFWRFIRDSYGAHYVVVDAKNSANDVTKNDALQIANI